VSDSPYIIIDFPAQPRRVFSSPGAVLHAHRLDEVRGVIGAAHAAALQGRFVGGFVSYEAAPAFDPVMEVRAGGSMPLAWFGIFDAPDAEGLAATQSPSLLDWQVAPEAAAFRDAIQRIREEIASGRTYQVNLTARFRSRIQEDPVCLYESLRRAQGAGYHACIDTGEFAVLSASPELFFETRDGRIRTKPMKGTRPRGRWREEDEAFARELAASEKDRAENLMIVDLLRNDVGRVARVGTVNVTSLFDVEQYRTVHQMTSTVEAELRSDVAFVDIFAALFPCGSVTGAPKISTMQLIAELEAAPREVYCGAVGIIEPGGNATFNVPIRTVWLDRRTHLGVYGAGAGITYDSDAAAEYAETVAKAAVLTEAWPEFELLETMRAENHAIGRLERHVARVLESARYFGIPASEQQIRAALARAAAQAEQPVRVRLLVNANGQPRTEVLPLDDIGVATVALAQGPVSSRDRFLFHKTTNRRVYDMQRDAQPDCWDVLLWNERGEVTEFTRGNVVVEIDGELLTPARSCGLLAGTFRAELLESGTVREQVILRSDLVKATRVWFINSVREWVEVAVR
jgi:para-aminobenzoate synthetase/4-amino-4-deoxychorismate lyase